MLLGILLLANSFAENTTYQGSLSTFDTPNLVDTMAKKWSVNSDSLFWRIPNISIDGAYSNISVSSIFMEQITGNVLLNSNILLYTKIPLSYQNYTTVPEIGNISVGTSYFVRVQRNVFSLGSSISAPTFYTVDIPLFWKYWMVKPYAIISRQTEKISITSTISARWYIGGNLLPHIDISMYKKVANKQRVYLGYTQNVLDTGVQLQLANIGYSYIWNSITIQPMMQIPVNIQTQVSNVVYRMQLQVSPGFEKKILDRDQDGIDNSMDICQDIPEDYDGFQDEDGCPDIDNDQDGIEDIRDFCIFLPEDYDGFQDEDGCPEPDNDNDNILDAIDRCPNAKETVNNYRDEDGCPDVGTGDDYDGDKKLDYLDRCPFEPEDYDGFQDEDGCPDIDNDQDGVIDK